MQRRRPDQVNWCQDRRNRFPHRELQPLLPDSFARVFGCAQVQDQVRAATTLLIPLTTALCHVSSDRRPARTRYMAWAALRALLVCIFSVFCLRFYALLQDPYWQGSTLRSSSCKIERIQWLVRCVMYSQWSRQRPLNQCCDPLLAVVISLEEISTALYTGNKRSMLLQNTLFRSGGAGAYAVCHQSLATCASDPDAALRTSRVAKQSTGGRVSGQVQAAAYC